MTSYTLISSDCHAGADGAEYRAYVDPAYRDTFDEYLALASMMGRGARRGAEELDDASRSLYDMAVRERYLDAEGVAAEVIFPQPGGPSGPPFYMAGHSYDDADQELTAAGTRAYNRWLADFTANATEPARHIGVAQITQYHDLDAAVAEVRWAHEAGLVGVLLRSQPEGDTPPFNHPRYEPLWSVCEELEMPLHTHGGESVLNGSLAENFMLPGGMTIFFTEVTWFGHRPLWYLLWSGVLDRHPNLKLVFTEQFADWVPDVLWRMDSIQDRFGAHANPKLDLRPSEYWHRQCYVGSSLSSRREMDRRHEIGVGSIMWGTDFPHAEGTFPESSRLLHESLDGLPEDELCSILGGTAAEVYRIDLERLAPVTARVRLEEDFNPSHVGGSNAR
jgi:predicted TIM-barrel fold metal-dependent hydrolase